MTEATFVCTFPFSKRPVKQASCGLLMPNMEMQVILQLECIFCKTVKQNNIVVVVVVVVALLLSCNVG